MRTRLVRLAVFRVFVIRRGYGRHVSAGPNADANQAEPGRVEFGVPDLLRRTLATTNTVESALSVAVKVTGRVKPCRDGNMRFRWCTAGLLRAEERFRRVKGHKQLPLLAAALERIANPQPLEERK